MKLTPMDINNKEFKRGLRGYNPEEVDEFLDEVVENYEELYKDNSKLREKVATLTEQIEHYSKIESTIQNTLVLAQNAADHADVIQINDEYDRVKQEFIKFRAKFRNFINTQLETFDDLEKDVTKNYNISTPVEDEAAIDSEVQFNEESFKTIEEDILTDNIDEIKSFFASKED